MDAGGANRGTVDDNATIHTYINTYIHTYIHTYTQVVQIEGLLDDNESEAVADGPKNFLSELIRNCGDARNVLRYTFSELKANIS